MVVVVLITAKVQTLSGALFFCKPCKCFVFFMPLHNFAYQLLYY